MKYIFIPYAPAGKYYSSGFHVSSLEPYDTAVYMKFVMQSGKIREGWIELEPFEQKHVSVKQLSDIIIGSQNTVYEHYELFLETSDYVFISPREVSLIDIEGVDVMFNNNSEVIDASGWPVQNWLMIGNNDEYQREAFEETLAPWYWASQRNLLRSLDKDRLEVFKFILRRMYFQFPNSADRMTHVMDFSANEGATQAQIEAEGAITPEHLAAHGTQTANAVDLGYYTSITNATQITSYAENNPGPVPYTNMWHGSKTTRYSPSEDDGVSLPKYFDAQKNFYFLQMLEKYIPSSRVITEQRIVKAIEEKGHTYDWSHWNNSFQSWDGTVDSLPNITFSAQIPGAMDHLLHYHINLGNVNLTQKVE